MTISLKKEESINIINLLSDRVEILKNVEKEEKNDTVKKEILHKIEMYNNLILKLKRNT